MRNPCFVLIALALSLSPSRLLAQQPDWTGKVEKRMQVREKKEKTADKYGQWAKQAKEWGLDTNFNHALTLGARLNTNGWSAGITYLDKPGGKAALWSLHFSEIRHEKETKLQNTGAYFTELGKNTPFAFGKVNNLYTLQLAYGRERVLFPALLNGNMSVSLQYAAGPSLAFEKPYYLQLIHEGEPPSRQNYARAEKYGKENADSFLRTGNILGHAKWAKGLGETKVVPGLFAEAALVIDPDKPKAFIKRVTIGGNAAFYSRPLVIMAERKAYPYQLSFFVGLSLGKRWK